MTILLQLSKNSLSAGNVFIASLDFSRAAFLKKAANHLYSKTWLAAMRKAY
jgi:hypothetical protein